MIRIVTDSSCDLPQEEIARHRIAVVPLTIRFGEDDFVDGGDLDGDQFWERLMAAPEAPSTAAPSIGRFQETFTRLSGEGADGILVVTLSSRISATHQAATLAAEQYPGGIPIQVIDSGLVSAALGLVALDAAETAAAGGSLDEVGAAARRAAAGSNLFAALDTLDHLRRGGRIGPAQAFFGSLLDFKPLITFADGEVAAAGRVRTRRRALEAVIAHLADLGDRVRRLAVVHSEPADLSSFVESVAETHGETAMLARLGPVVGTHAGPGVAGIAYLLGDSAE